MPVSALLIEVRSNTESIACEKINSIPGVEVRAQGDGKLAAVTDIPDSKDDYKTIESINALEEVVHISVVFTASEELAESQEG